MREHQTINEIKDVVATLRDRDIDLKLYERDKTAWLLEVFLALTQSHLSETRGAPHRIWASSARRAGCGGGWSTRQGVGATEYLRCDLVMAAERDPGRDLEWWTEARRDAFQGWLDANPSIKAQMRPPTATP